MVAQAAIATEAKGKVKKNLSAHGAPARWRSDNVNGTCMPWVGVVFQLGALARQGSGGLLCSCNSCRICCQACRIQSANYPGALGDVGPHGPGLVLVGS